ncbi:unnamed protein product [Thlaspi arvense]|uniref:MADS-box domain-containing protein n=1 Tax=Thlaspi arvense TaxID=13288 RepID=A0AAU9SJK5_THLAR|nr:unnamed protein product [Thlaspi arvense]
MDSSSSSSSTSKNAKLSVRSKPSFKKSAFSAAKKITNLAMREQTILKKASELSTLCEIQACVIHYSRDGELVNTWPEDQSKTQRDLSRVLEGKDDSKFEQKVMEIEASLEDTLRILQDRAGLVLDLQDHQTGPNSLNQYPSSNFSIPPADVTTSCSLNQDPSSNFSIPPADVTTSYSLNQDPSSNFSIPPADLTTSCSLNQDPSSNFLIPPADLTTSCSLNQDPSSNFSIPADLTTSCSLNQDPSNFSIPADVTSLNQYPSNFSLLLYNHDDGTFTQLPNSAPPSFEQPPIPYYNQDSSYLDLLLAEEDMRSCNNSVLTPSIGFPTMLIS